MELNEAIQTRRSVRHYENKPVPEEVVTTVLRAAMQAPSAMNQQAWHFVVVDDRATLDRIAAGGHADMCAEAPLAVLICADTRIEKAPGMWVQDCSAATQNLLLAAHAAGLGAVWTSAYPGEASVKDYRDLFGLPEGVLPLNLVPMGYPAETVAPEDRYQPTRIHRNRW